MRCDFAHDDGAYVLGALSPAERSAYERHLGNCPACREAVAEIAVLPGLLGRLDSATALQLLGEEPAPGAAGHAPTVRPAVSRESDGEARVISLVSAAAERRRRERLGRRLRYAGSALAAACLAVVVALGVGVLRTADGTVNPPGGPTGPQLAAMQPAPDIPNVQDRIKALVGMDARDWGTSITMECSYETPPTGADPTGAWVVHLIAYGPDDQQDHLGSWTALPGTTVKFDGATRFTKGQLVKLALVGASGKTLLTYNVA